MVRLGEVPEKRRLFRHLLRLDPSNKARVSLKRLRNASGGREAEGDTEQISHIETLSGDAAAPPADILLSSTHFLTQAAGVRILCRGGGTFGINT